jgi:Tol biopolymer transport system component
LVRLTETPANLADFVGDYSPDGTLFLFKRTTDEDPAPLLVVPAAGGEPTRLSDLLVEDPGRYSPDGETILTSAGGRIVMLDTAGHEVGEIVQPGSFLFGPVWSPDGDHVAYSGTESGVFHADIYTSRPDGSDRRQATSTPDNEIRVEWGSG